MDIIKNFFIEEDLKIILGWLGIDYKKAMNNRIILSSFFACLTIVLGLYFNSLFIILSSIIVGIGYYKYQYLSVKRKCNKLAALKRRMFPAFVKKVLILIRTNNIYNSFIKMVDYTDEPIKKYLEDLIEDIKEDKSITPFMKFAEKMEFSEAKLTMAMLYTFSEHAMSRKHLVSLESSVSNLYDNEIDEVIEKKKRILWLYPNFCIIAMLFMIFSLAIYMFINIMSEVSFG